MSYRGTFSDRQIRPVPDHDGTKNHPIRAREPIVDRDDGLLQLMR